LQLENSGTFRCTANELSGVEIIFVTHHTTSHHITPHHTGRTPHSDHNVLFHTFSTTSVSPHAAGGVFARERDCWEVACFEPRADIRAKTLRGRKPKFYVRTMQRFFVFVPKVRFRWFTTDQKGNSPKPLLNSV
jgi:hypothetical protein